MTDPQRSQAHAYLTALTDAIETVSDATGDAELTYRGASLRATAERALFVALGNHDGLYAAFVDGTPVRLATPLEAAVASVVAVGRVAGPGRVRRWRARRAQRALLAAAPAGVGAAVAPSSRGGAWFVLDHAKFLALVDPVARELGQPRARVLWAHSSLRPAERRDDPALDELPAAPSADAAGRALLGHGALLAEFDRMSAAIERLRPERLVVVEGNSPYDGVVAAAGQAAAIPVDCLQNGWSPIVHAGFRRMPYRQMLVWGHGLAELLIPHNPGLTFVATGHPTLADERPSSGVLAQRIAGRPAAAFFLQPPSPYNAPAHLDAFLALIDAVAEAAPQAALVVRAHPSLPFADRAWAPNVVPTAGPAVGLRETILAAAAVVSIYSTSLLEGAAMGRPAISLNQTSLPRLLPDLEAEGAGLETRDTSAAADAITELLAGNGAERYAAGLAAVRERYFDGLRPGAAQRAAAAISS